MLTQRATVYQTRAVQSRARNARIDSRLSTEFAARQVALAAKLDAIVAANKAKQQPLTDEQIEAELEDLVEGIADDEYHRSGGW